MKTKLQRFIRISIPSLAALFVMVTQGRSSGVSFSATAPAGDVFFSTSRSSSNESRDWKNVGTGAQDDRWLGENFRVSSDFVLDKITVALSPATSSTQFSAVVGTSASIRVLDMGSTSFVSFNGAVSPVGTLQVDSGLALPASLSSGFLTFDITDLQLSSGKNYAFVLSLDGAGAANRVLKLYFSNGSSVSYSFLSYDDGVTYTSSGTPMEFYLQGHAGTIPEPATTVLILGAGALVGGIMLKRRQRGSV
ncbi:MAG: PEP-CTERM sorting domain-containing protein [Opitutaceae bacterium]|jgi:hypothetical protein